MKYIKQGAFRLVGGALFRFERRKLSGRPATITLAVKAAIAAATDKRTWKAVGVLIAAI
jgi:hypothetical protein